jgi:hypothetical protein
MIAETATRYVYRIDAEDRVTFVSPEWLRFAEENDACELTADRVVGQPIWNFITGDDSREFYASIFGNLRLRGTEITIPFRCDSPTVVRQMNLTLRLLPEGKIECEGVLLQARSREPITVLFRWVIRTDETIPICSLCRRLSVQGEWLELRDAVTRAGIVNVAPVPRLQETVCPTCNCITK